MILYMDVYITDTPLFKNLYDDLTDLRSRAKIYNAPSKIDVTIYTLASYAIYPWSNVLIKYELEDKSKNEYFENEVLKIFPNALLIEGRSDSQKKYQESVRMLEKMDDEWIFYTGNNDHPFVFGDMKILETCLDKAKELRQKHKFVAIWYSHMLEAAGFLGKGRTIGKHIDRNGICESEIISEDEDLYVTKRKQDLYLSTQILHIDILKYWFFTSSLGQQRIRRTDDLPRTINTGEQVLILPKRRICEHFDGYGNLNSIVGFSVDELVPPLFIPPGFFENDIKISFGYDDYREGWVNVNPFKNKYSFSDQKNGTDLRIGLNDLPLFWKARISKIDINPAIDLKRAERIGNENEWKLATPWPTSSLDIALSRFVVSPIWRFRKLLRRTRVYLKDPDFLEKTKDEGNVFFKLYKNTLFFAIKSFRKKPKEGK